MLESNFHFHRKYSNTHKKTKEEQVKEIEGLPKNIGPYEIILKFTKQNHVIQVIL